MPFLPQTGSPLMPYRSTISDHPLAVAARHHLAVSRSHAAPSAARTPRTLLRGTRRGCRPTSQDDLPFRVWAEFTVPTGKRK